MQIIKSANADLNHELRQLTDTSKETLSKQSSMLRVYICIYIHIYIYINLPIESTKNTPSFKFGSGLRTLSIISANSRPKSQCIIRAWLLGLGVESCKNPEA
jgi:hypothetical protein